MLVRCLQLNIVEGKRQYLYDERGRRYLDAFAGIATVCCGHCHPDVVDAITAQAGRLQHSTVLYLNHAITDFAEALASKLPGDLKVYRDDCWRPAAPPPALLNSDRLASDAELFLVTPFIFAFTYISRSSSSPTPARRRTSSPS